MARRAWKPRGARTPSPGRHTRSHASSSSPRALLHRVGPRARRRPARVDRRRRHQRHVEHEPLLSHRVEGHPAPGERVERITLERDVGTTMRHASTAVVTVSPAPRACCRTHPCVKSCAAVTLAHLTQFSRWMPPRSTAISHGAQRCVGATFGLELPGRLQPQPALCFQK